MHPRHCQVYPGVWIGNKAAAESAPLLASLGVTHLLNCAGGARDTAGGVTGRGTVRPDTAALAARGIQYRSELTVSLEFSNSDIDIHCYVQRAGAARCEGREHFGHLPRGRDLD